MSRIVSLLTQVYSALLRLYPSRFRIEFTDELQSVFSDAMSEAARQGKRKLAIAFLRELRDLPGAALREHWLQRSESIMGNKPRASWLELLGAATPFLLYLAFPIVRGLQIGWAGAVIVLIAGVLIIVMIAGLFKGMPRWSLPGLGFLLAVLNGILLSFEDPIFTALNSILPLLPRGFLGAGFPYVGVIVLAGIVVLATATIKPLRPVFQRIWEDWTLLPFALYGMMPLVIFISFDEYQGDMPYQIGIGLVLLASLWLYLRNTQPGQKLLALGIGITLAMAIDAIGKWIIVPSQNWSIWFQWHTVEEATQIEVISTVYAWFWVMIVVFLPAWLGLLPRSIRLTPATQP